MWFSGPQNPALPLTSHGTWTKLPDPLSILQPQFPPLDIGVVRALPVPQREGHLIGGECSKELGFIVAVSICAGPGQQGHLMCELHTSVLPSM